MTASPYPDDTRAKGWRFELDHERIEQSNTWTLAPLELRPWLLMLWMTAWKQTPCGSLDDDDQLIAARVGMPLKLFTKHKAILMRGWWKADDGRLYHDTITQRVRAMLAKRVKDAERTANRRARMADASATPPGVTPVSHVTPTGARSEFDTKHQAPVNSEAKASGDSPDPIFGDGLAYLVRTGVPEKGARSFLGKMRKAINDDLVAVELIVKAQQLEVSDPVPWLRAAAQKRIGPSSLGGTGGVAL